MILGLDISTTTIGYCILTPDGKLEKLGFFQPPKKIKDLFEKVDAALKFFNEELKKYTITHIFVEESLKKFAAGMSSSTTIDTLAKFNGIISYSLYKQLDVKPEFFNASSARKIMEISFKDNPDVLDEKIITAKQGNTKEQIFAWLLERDLKNFDFEIKTRKSGKDAGKEFYAVTSFDMSDAYVIAKAGFLSMKKDS